MPFSYANPTSGPSAGGIGWFDFGNLSLAPGQSATGLTGTLNDGTTVTFDIAATNISGANRTFTATPVPTYSGAFFGRTNYTGITGNVALYTNELFLFSDNALTISNITVRDSNNDPVPNYTVVVGDAESTGVNEFWNFNTNGSVWNLFTTLGNATDPTLTGVGTQTVTFTGNNPEQNQNDYFFTTQNPTQLVLSTSTVTLNGGQQAVVIGFATTRVRMQKNVGSRIALTDQFQLNIAGTPGDTATTTGSASGIQAEVASVFAVPGSPYTFSEAMAPGSGSVLTDYTQIVSASNATPAGSVPSAGSLPITFMPALGDDVTYTVLNAAPEVFAKTVDKAFADVGEVLTYTVTVDNPNDFTVNNVLVTDATPAGTTYLGNLSVSAPYTGTDPATGITITTIAPSSSVTLSWQVQVNTFPPVPNPVPNYAMVTVPEGTFGMTNVVTTQINTAFVSILKTVNKAFAATGDLLTYTLTLNNAGNVAANNVNIVDVIPAGTTFVPGSVIGAAGTPPTLTLTNPIPAGGSASVSFQVKIGDAIPNPNPIPNTPAIAYTYTVDPANPNGASGSRTGNTVTTQVNTALVSTVKSVDKAFAVFGDVLTYTLALQNTGSVAADNVVITDAIPAGTAFIPGSVTGATGTPPTLALTAPIPAGGSAVVTFQVMVGDTIPAPNPIPNTADIAYSFTVDPESPNTGIGTGTSNTVTTQVNAPIITPVKAVDKAYADTGDVLTYTFTLQNIGNTAADNVALTDAVPAGTTFIPGSVTGAAGTPPTLVLANPIAPGGTAVVTFQVRVGDTVPTPNPISNTASVSFTYTSNPNVPDGETGDAQSNTVTTQVNHASATPVKTVDKAYAQPGDVLTYTVTLQNTSNITANHVVLTDAVPAGTAFVPGSVTGATGTPPTLTLTNPIPAGGNAVVTFQVKVTGIPAVNPIPNFASSAYTYTVDPAVPDGKTGTEKSNTVTTQVSIATLTVQKAVDKSAAYLGDVISYQLAVTNTGNVPADNVVLTDLITAGVTYVPGSLTANVPVTGTPAAIQIVNPVAPGATVSISFHAKVTALPNPNPVLNRATANYTYTVDPGDPDGVPGTTTSNEVCTLVFRYNFGQQITDLTESVALEQAALAAIANAEGAKIQKLVSAGSVSTQELLCLNRSVADMLNSLAMLESVLKQKFSIVGCQINGCGM